MMFGWSREANILTSFNTPSISFSFRFLIDTLQISCYAYFGSAIGKFEQKNSCLLFERVNLIVREPPNFEHLAKGSRT